MRGVVKMYIEDMGRSLLPIGLRLLKDKTKPDLIMIILTREKMLYENMEVWRNTLKTNDRKVFHTLKKEIDLLNSLFQTTEAGKEIEKLKTKIRNLQGTVVRLGCKKMLGVKSAP